MSTTPRAGAVLAVTAALAAVLLLWPRRSEASQDGGIVYDDNPMPDWGSDYGPGEVEIVDPQPVGVSEMSVLAAFLYMIRRAEHFPADVETGRDYYTVYGGSRINDLRDHPVATGEWKGRVLSDSMCAAAGFGPGCKSTAAGGYQIIYPTWQRVRQAGAWGPYLADFSPQSQDEAARRLLIEARALPLLMSGDVVGAISRIAQIWASLPGSTAKQGPKTLDTVLSYFNRGLEIFA